MIQIILEACAQRGTLSAIVRVVNHRHAKPLQLKKNREFVRPAAVIYHDNPAEPFPAQGFCIRDKGGRRIQRRDHNHSVRFHVSSSFPVNSFS